MSVRRAAGRPALAVLLVLLVASCGEARLGPPPGSRRVSIPAAGGGTLEAIELGSSPRVVVLSHGATTTKEDLYETAVAFADDGWRAIAYDAGSDREADIEAVVGHARDTGAESIVLIGSSLGASLSIATASELHADAVVSLSASADAFGALGAAGELRVPLFVAAADGDQPFAVDAGRIAGAAGVEPVIVGGDRHGAGMFRDHPELMDEVVAFADEATGG